MSNDSVKISESDSNSDLELMGDDLRDSIRH